MGRKEKVQYSHFVHIIEDVWKLARSWADQMTGVDGPLPHFMLRIPKFKVVLPVKTYMYEYNLLQRWAGKRTLNGCVAPNKLMVWGALHAHELTKWLELMVHLFILCYGFLHVSFKSCFARKKRTCTSITCFKDGQERESWMAALRPKH